MSAMSENTLTDRINGLEEPSPDPGRDRDRNEPEGGQGGKSAQRARCKSIAGRADDRLGRELQAGSAVALN